MQNTEKQRQQKFMKLREGRCGEKKKIEENKDNEDKKNGNEVPSKRTKKFCNSTLKIQNTQRAWQKKSNKKQKEKRKKQGKKQN